MKWKRKCSAENLKSEKASNLAKKRFFQKKRILATISVMNEMVDEFEKYGVINLFENSAVLGCSIFLTFHGLLRGTRFRSFAF